MTSLISTSNVSRATLALCVTAMLAGCGIGSVTPASPLAGAALRGTLMGGQQPVSASHIYVFQAGSGGAKTAASSRLDPDLLAASGAAAGTYGTDSLGTYVLTTAYGNFTIDNGYTCIPGTPVYLLAVGGNPGLSGSNVNNPQLAMVAVLGACPSDQAFAGGIVIDEVTTAAAAYALQGYFGGPGNLATSGSSLATTGINNAVANAALLANVRTGRANTANASGNATLPYTTLNTLADIIANCINSKGGSVGAPTNCGMLFTLTTTDGTKETAPTETFTALLNIARQPAANVLELLRLVPSNPPFLPNLPASNSVNDLTLPVVFTDTSLNSPGIPAVDAAGNAWFPNPGGNSVTVLSSVGAVQSGAGYALGVGHSPGMVAIDPLGNAWIGNAQSGTVTKLAGSSGTILGDYPFAGGSLNDGHQLAIDVTGRVYVSDYTAGNLVRLSSSGVVSTFNPSADPSSIGPLAGVALDHAGNLSTGQSGDGFSVITPTGVRNAGMNNTGLLSAFAADSTNRVWATVPSADSIVIFSNGRSVMSQTSRTSGLNAPGFIAIDGAGAGWVSNHGSTSISAFDSAGNVLSTSRGLYGELTVCRGNGIALDGSGDVWMSCDASAKVVEFIGVATPVVTPITVGRQGVTP